MGPNWLAFLVRALSAVPYVVAGIEQVHGSAMSGADKKELALQALNLSANVALGLDPQHQQLIGAAAQLASSTIDGTVAVMNAAKGSTAKPPVHVAAVTPSHPAPAAASSNHVADGVTVSQGAAPISELLPLR
jgi:predicted aconitase with swiveling domain